MEQYECKRTSRQFKKIKINKKTFTYHNKNENGGGEFEVLFVLYHEDEHIYFLFSFFFLRRVCFKGKMVRS